ncbi:unnamed protein product, partial [Closterium sp. Yama58-4]
MARKTAVAMLLPGLLLAILLTAAISILPLGRVDTSSQQEQVKPPLMLTSTSPTHDNATATGGPLSLLHAHAPNPPLQTINTLYPLLMVLYSAIATLMALMWGMGVTHMQVRAWVHQQGLAVTAGLMHRGICHLLHSLINCACAGMHRAGEAAGAVMSSMAGTHKLEGMLVTRMREMIRQAEERGGEVAAELAAVRRELAEQREMAERRRELDLRALREEMRMREDEVRAELAREREERRREVQEVIWPRLREELAECRKGLSVEVGIIQSDGHQRTAWQRINSASHGTDDLSLAGLNSISNAMLEHVSSMKQLKHVALYSSSGFTAEGIQHLYRLPQLQSLNLNSTDIADHALEGIGALTNLEILYLYDTKVTDAGLPHFTRIASLKELGLGECSVTDAGMVHVGSLTGLEKLWLNGTAVTDDGLQELRGLTKLTKLYPPEGGCLTNDDAH